MNINVTVDNVDLNSVVGTHYVRTGVDDYATEPQTLADIVAARIADDLKRDTEGGYPGLKKRAVEIRDEEIRNLIAPMIREAIEQPIQRTNEFGDPRGEPTTLAKLIVDEVHKYLAKSQGYGRDAETNVQKLVREAVDRTIKAELNEVIKEEKAKVVAAVRAKAAELIAEAVKQGVGR